MNFSENMCLMIILKVTKNQGFTLSVEDKKIFSKNYGGVSLIPPPFPAVLGLKGTGLKRKNKVNFLKVF